MQVVVDGGLLADLQFEKFPRTNRQYVWSCALWDPHFNHQEQRGATDELEFVHHFTHLKRKNPNQRNSGHIHCMPIDITQRDYFLGGMVPNASSLLGD